MFSLKNTIPWRASNPGLLFLRQMRWPLCHAASSLLVFVAIISQNCFNSSPFLCDILDQGDQIGRIFYLKVYDTYSGGRGAQWSTWRTSRKLPPRASRAGKVPAADGDARGRRDAAVQRAQRVRKVAAVKTKPGQCNGGLPGLPDFSWKNISKLGKIY
jgi:hypothetical protein